MTTHLSHDIPDSAPSWYVPQPASPWCVYGAGTIEDIQRTLSCAQTGTMDDNTINHIKGLQGMMGLNPTGHIDLSTAIQIQRLRDRFAVQE